MEMTKEVKEIVDNIKFNYRESNNQTAHMFSEGHTKFDCRMTYNGKSFQTTYQCNPNYSNMSNIKMDFIYSILLDKDAYDFCESAKIFADEYGYDYYEDKKEVDRIYRACKRTSERLEDIFTCEELDILQEFFREY